MFLAFEKNGLPEKLFTETPCMLHRLYAVPPVCCTACMLYRMYAVTPVCCTACMLVRNVHRMYAPVQRTETMQSNTICSSLRSKWNKKGGALSAAFLKNNN